MQRSKLLSIILAVLLLVLTALPAVSSDEHPRTLTYDRAADWATTFDTWYDRIPASAFPEIQTIADMQAWTAEAVPFFVYEGISFASPEKVKDTFTFPSSITLANYNTAQSRMHILGTTNCLTGAVTMNHRFTSDVSTLTDSRTILPTLIHELAHVQGICFDGAPINSESSAQLVMLEMLAAMTNRGNALTFGPLIFELRYMMLTAAHAAALAEDRLPDFWSLATRLAQSPFELATMEKAERYWAADPELYAHILTNYNLLPMQFMLTAVERGGCWFGDYVATDGSYIQVQSWNAQPCIPGVDLPLNWGNALTNPLVIDDLAYIIAHGDVLSRSLT